MLHLFGMVTAIAGLIFARFARGDNRTAQRHLGAVLSKAPVLAQQAGGTLALTLRVAPKHGLRLAAADPMGVLPHSPAASTFQMKPSKANTSIITMTKRALILKFIIFV